MKLTELFKGNKLSLSFEVFPPKTDTAFDSVKAATEEIAKQRPSFISVTYGAGGGTSRYTLEIAKNIKHHYAVPTLAHLTCVSSTKETVLAKIEEMKAAGIQNVMALRGDLTPELENSDRSHWCYQHAIDLIHDIKASGADFCIGGACYPEIHPESTNQLQAPIVGLSALMTTTVPAMEETIRLLKEKAPWCKVMVGGAVLNQEYADAIGADYYAKDAMEAVRYAEEIQNGMT